MFARSSLHPVLGVYPKEKRQQRCKVADAYRLAHDRIIFLGMHYIERGWITQDEYENLYEYLYKPYEKLSGNGSAKRIMTEVNKLPIRKSTYQPEEVTDHE